MSVILLFLSISFFFFLVFLLFFSIIPVVPSSFPTSLFLLCHVAHLDLVISFIPFILAVHFNFAIFLNHFFPVVHFDFSICSVCICYYSLSQILCFIYSLLLFLICDCFNIYFYSFPYPFYSTNFFYPSSCGFCSSLFPLLPIRSYYRLLFHPATSILLLWRSTWCAWKAWASWSTRS